MDDFVGVVLPDTFLLRPKEAAVALVIRDLVVYPSALLFSMVAIANPSHRRTSLLPTNADPLPESMELRLGSEAPEGGLSVELRHDNGTVWTESSEKQDSPASIERLYGLTTQRAVSYWFWCTPLPPPPEVAIVVNWPTMAIEASEVRLDSSRIVEAGSENRSLWDED